MKDEQSSPDFCSPQSGVPSVCAQEVRCSSTEHMHCWSNGADGASDESCPGSVSTWLRAQFLLEACWCRCVRRGCAGGQGSDPLSCALILGCGAAVSGVAHNQL